MGGSCLLITKHIKFSGLLFSYARFAFQALLASSYSPEEKQRRDIRGQRDLMLLLLWLLLKQTIR